MAEKRYSDGPLNTATHAAAVTPNDSTEVTSNGLYPRALYVGGAGDVAVQMVDGATVTFAGANAGQLLQIAVAKVLATGTTASSIVALW